MSYQTTKLIAQSHAALAAWKLEASKGRTADECKQLFTQLDGAINAVAAPTARPGDLAAAVLARSPPTGPAAGDRRLQALIAACGRLQQDVGHAFDGKQVDFTSLDKMYARACPFIHRNTYTDAVNGHSYEDMAAYDERDCAIYQLGYLKQHFNSQVLKIKTPRAERRPVRRHRRAGDDSDDSDDGDDDDFHGDAEGFFAAKQRQWLAREAAEIVDMLMADVQTADACARASVLEALAGVPSAPADPEFRRFLADEVIASLMPILSGHTIASSSATDTPLRDVALDVVRQQYPAATDDNLAHALKVVKAKGALLILDENMDETSLLQGYEPVAASNSGGIVASVASLLWRGSSAGAADAPPGRTGTGTGTDTTTGSDTTATTTTILPALVDTALAGAHIFHQASDTYDNFTLARFFAVEIYSTRLGQLNKNTIQSLRHRRATLCSNRLADFARDTLRFAQRVFVVPVPAPAGGDADADAVAGLAVYNFIALWIVIRACQLVEVAEHVDSCTFLPSDDDSATLTRYFAAADTDGWALLANVLPVFFKMVDIWIDGLASLI